MVFATGRGRPEVSTTMNIVAENAKAKLHCMVIIFVCLTLIMSSNDFIDYPSLFVGPCTGESLSSLLFWGGCWSKPGYLGRPTWKVKLQLHGVSGSSAQLLIPQCPALIARCLWPRSAIWIQGFGQPQLHLYTAPYCKMN